MKVLEFTSEKIPVVPYEDDHVNPGILGRGLANWLTDNLIDTPFPITEVVAEDWGYCAFVHRKPYWLYIGLAGHTDFEWPENELSEDVVRDFPLGTIAWQLWARTEMGWISRLTGQDNRKQDARNLLETVSRKLDDAGIEFAS